MQPLHDQRRELRRTLGYNQRLFILNGLTRGLDFVIRVDEREQGYVNRQFRLSHSKFLSLTATDSFETQFSATQNVVAEACSFCVPGTLIAHTRFLDKVQQTR